MVSIRHFRICFFFHLSKTMCCIDQMNKNMLIGTFSYLHKLYIIYKSCFIIYRSEYYFCWPAHVHLVIVLKLTDIFVKIRSPRSIFILFLLDTLHITFKWRVYSDIKWYFLHFYFFLFVNNESLLNFSFTLIRFGNTMKLGDRLFTFFSY